MMQLEYITSAKRIKENIPFFSQSIYSKDSHFFAPYLNFISQWKKVDGIKFYFLCDIFFLRLSILYT